ncbi:MAG: hypothetical protein ACFB16_22345 [Phormidesmis sp.]
MTLNAIDQALDVVLTGLVYGSGTWLACTFGFYLVTRRRKQKAPPLLAPSARAAAVEQGMDCTRQTVDSVPSIEIIIEQPPAPQQAFSHRKAATVVAWVPEETVSPKESPEEAVEEATTQKVAQPLKIACEPVDWKKWKVADLRKASVAKVCGVRTRPIGSRRNLPKADLIAQYEQQLKRLTKLPPEDVKPALKQDIVA